MQLRIGGLSPDTVSEDLIPFITNLGVFEFVTVIRDVASGKSKGYAIVKIPDNESAQEAINKLNGSFIKGSRISVSLMSETIPGEMEYREWLAYNAGTVLRTVGLRAKHTILDFGCGPGNLTDTRSGNSWGERICNSARCAFSASGTCPGKGEECRAEEYKDHFATKPRLNTGLPKNEKH